MSIRKRIKKIFYRHVPGYVGEYPYFGVTVHYPKRAWIIDRVCDEGLFEWENATLISSMVRGRSWYYDVGANLGFLSIPILSRNPDVQVASFEPSPSYLPYLTRTAKESTFSERWRVIGEAVGEKVGEIEFGVGSVSSYDDMIANPTFLPKANRTVRVPVTTIDEFWRSTGRPDVSVIKIDTEGAEYKGLSGAEECVANCRPVLLVECSEPHLRAFGQTPAEIFNWVVAHGYSIICLPHVIPVRNLNEFQVHLLYSYNFLFLPDRKP